MGELNVATGALSQVLFAQEVDWGVPPPSTTATLLTNPWRHWRLIGGETLDPNFAEYRSAEIKNTRDKNRTVTGTQRPGGSMPFELAARGQNPLFWNLLGGTVTKVHGTTSPASCVQTLYITGVPTGGSLYLSYEGQTTSALSVTATLPTGAQVQTALQALSTIGASNATVSPTGFAATFAITFAGSLANMNVSMISAESYMTGGTNPDAFVVLTTSGLASGWYRHTIKSSTTLPTGLSFEKLLGGMAAGSKGYNVLTGGRVTHMGMNFGIDAIPSGQFDMLFREAKLPSATSMQTHTAPTQYTDDPYTSAQCVVFEGASLYPMAIAKSVNLEYDNGFDPERGFRLGSDKRAFCKPGQIDAMVNGEFYLVNSALYEAARAGTAAKMQLYCHGGSTSQNSWLWKMNTGRFLANGSLAKIVDDKDIFQQGKFESAYDTGNAANAMLEITTQESDITAYGNAG